MTGILVPCVMDLQSTKAADALGFWGQRYSLWLRETRDYKETTPRNAVVAKEVVDE
jgi:hypothetical protein